MASARSSTLTLAVVLDHAVADEVAQKPGSDDLEQVRDGDVRDARQGVEHRLPVGTSDKNSIQRDEVKVWIQFEVSGNPLYDGDGTALATAGTFDFHAPAVPAEDRVDEDARDRPQQAAIVREPGAQGVRHGKDKRNPFMDGCCATPRAQGIDGGQVNYDPGSLKPCAHLKRRTGPT